jgi:phospholipid/cholesterol/gamma-HCH transport system permease protein
LAKATFKQKYSVDLLYHIGRYAVFMNRVFSRPEKRGIYYSQLVREIDKIGISSLGIVALMSVFMGAVIALQTAAAIDSPLVPLYTVGFTTRQSVILEFSPTILSLILAGKVGSNIASEIGTMRVTEQIDALEIMGVNSAAYLVQPKVLAGVFIFPFLIGISMFLGVFGGWFICKLTSITTTQEYIYGIQYDFKPFHVSYAFVKTVVFAFVITSVAAFHGYHARGSALEVGRSSTQAVVYSSVLILLLNYILTQLILI